jgi:lycopene beta-cyclase
VKTDLLLVGGGLANSLIALRMQSVRPEIAFLVVEQQPSLGADHTWSFHDSDLGPGQLEWMRPLVAHSWQRHELVFPRRRRVMVGGYNSVTSDRLHEVATAALGDRVLLGTAVSALRPDGARLGDGRWIEASAVIDGRGDPGGGHLDIGFQKFVGLFVRLAAPHRLGGPILMDATVDQTDGYRFVYTLPFSPTELLIEDTYYADGPELDDEDLRRGITDYATARGWEIVEISGSERGVLPIVLGGDIQAFWSTGPPGVARSGMRGAFFHPTTGYSLPEAVRLADAIAAMETVSGESLFRHTRHRSSALWKQTAYFRLLNRMLFRAAEPELRYRVFERFYGLSEGLIRRFYAGRLTWFDKIRLVVGKPPVPIRRAVGCMVERRPRSKSRPRTEGGGST